jgi:hypothetical protein
MAPGPDAVVVYVAPLGDGRPFSLDLQVAVVRKVGDAATVRFVDEFSEAIDVEADRKPVLDDGVLLWLGSVTSGDGVVTVEAERFRSAADGGALTFRLDEVGDGWDVSAGRERRAPTTVPG